MRLHTANSTYEVDESAKRIRRLAGQHPPTQRFQADGEWRDYERLGVHRAGAHRVEEKRPQVGASVVIFWPDERGLMPHTITSPVAEIVYDEEAPSESH